MERRSGSTLSERLLALLTPFALAALAEEELRRPRPQPRARPDGARLASVIKREYPQLLVERIAGTVLVTLLVDARGGALQTDLQVVAPDVTLTIAGESHFARFGLAASDLEFVGVGSVSLPANTVVVVFAGIDSLAVDQALVKRCFPGVLTHGASLGKRLWVLFDHGGRFVAAGEDSFEPADLRSMLERRFPEIRTSVTSVAILVNGEASGSAKTRRQTVRLHCVWLAVGSRLPTKDISKPLSGGGV